MRTDANAMYLTTSAMTRGSLQEPGAEYHTFYDSVSGTVIKFVSIPVTEGVDDMRQRGLSYSWM